MKVNRKELCEIFGIDERTVYRWSESGLQFTKINRENQYDTIYVHKWLLEREIDKRITETRPGVENYDLEQERARLAHHQANIAEISEKEKAGRLLPSEWVDKSWELLVTSCRARILSIPTKSAHEFIHMTNISEIQECLKKHLYEALKELSEYVPTDEELEEITGESVNDFITSA